MKMRGPGMNDTDEGAEMFSMTRNQFLAIRSMAPSVDREDYSWLLHQTCPDAYVSRVATLTITCSEIRMQVDRLLTGGRRDPRRIQAVLDILRKAQAISKKLSDLDRPQNAVWRVGTTAGAARGKGGRRPLAAGQGAAGAGQEEAAAAAAAVDPSLGERYSFHNLYVCMIYCIIWTSHLFLTTCIFRCMAWLVSPDEWRSGAEYEAAVEVTKRRVADICAALPYACSWNGYNTGYADFVCGVASPSSPSKGVAGLCIFRPAFTAMMSDYATAEQKEYLEGRLRFLADGVGIKQATILLKVSHSIGSPCVYLGVLPILLQRHHLLAKANNVYSYRMKQLTLQRISKGTELARNFDELFGIFVWFLRSTVAYRFHGCSTSSRHHSGTY